MAGSSTYAQILGRLTWATSVLFAVLTVGACLIAALIVVGSPRSMYSWRNLAVVLPALPFALYTPSQRGGAWRFNENLLGWTAYSGTNAQLFVSVVEALAFSALTGIAFAAGCVLYRTTVRRHGTSDEIEARLVDLARHHRHIRLLLYTGAAALVGGTLEVTALYQWAVNLLDPTYARVEDSKDLPQAMGLLTGSFYSLLLASIFVPTYGTLRVHAEHLADNAKPTATAAERKAWLIDNAIDASVPRQILSILAVLSPLIAGGPVTQILDMLAQ